MEGATRFPGLLHFTLDTFLIILRVKQVLFFESLVWLYRRLNLCFPGHWRTLYPLDNGPVVRVLVFNTRSSHTQGLKRVLDKVLIKGKMSNSRKGVGSSSTPRCSSFWKGSLRVAIDHGRPTYSLFISIYLYLYIFANHSERAEYDTRSFFKQVGVRFSNETSCSSKVKEPCLPDYLSIAGGRIAGFRAFP